MADVRVEVYQGLSNFWFAKIIDPAREESLRDDEDSRGSFWRKDAVEDATEWAEDHNHTVIGVDYT